MKCIKCNHENIEDALFCESCGNPLNNENTDGVAQSHTVSVTEITGDFCSSCGKPLEKGASFCAECGAQQEIICPKCETTNPVGAAFCQNCATAFPVICPKCKTENTAGAEFCENCGAKIDQRKRKIYKHPAFIAAASIVLLVGFAFLFTENRVNHHLELAEEAFTNQDYSYVTGKVADAEKYAFLSSQKEKIEKTHFAIISRQTDKAVSKTKNEEYEKAAKQLKIADQFCTTAEHTDFVNQKYKTCLDMLIEKGNSYTSSNKFKSAKKIYASAELFTKTSTQKDLLADNVSDYKSKKSSYYAKLRRQRQYSSSSSYSSGNSGSVTQADIYFIWATEGACWSQDWTCRISDPTYNSSTSDRNYNTGLITNNNGIAGTYHFYVTVKCGKTYSASGSFYIDGRKSSYTVTIDPYGGITVQ